MLQAPPFKDFEFPTVLEALLVVAWADGVLHEDEEIAVRGAVSILFGSKSSLSASSQRRPEPEAVAAKLAKMTTPQQLWILRQCYSLARADGDVAQDELALIMQLGTPLGVSEAQWPELLLSFAKYDELEMELATLLEPTRAAQVCGILAAHLYKKAESRR